MEPAWADAQGDEQRRVWSEVLRPAAAELAERAREISAAVNDYTRARLSDLLADEQALEVNRASTEASILDFAQVLSSGDDPLAAVQLQSPTLDYARDGAQHGIPLTTLMRSYRLAHAASATHFTAILQNHASNAEELHLASELGSAWMFAYVDAALCLVEEVYTAERDRWLRSAAASQAETIATILAGEPIDTTWPPGGFATMSAGPRRCDRLARISRRRTQHAGRPRSGDPRHRLRHRQSEAARASARNTVDRRLDQLAQPHPVEGVGRVTVPDCKCARCAGRDR